MDVLLTIAVVCTALAVIGQFCVLFAIYQKSKTLGAQLDRFMKETRDIMSPVKAITENLRTASGNLVEIGLAAREQFRRIETMVAETGEALHVQFERWDKTSNDVMNRVNETADIVQNSIVRPIREVSALVKGVSRGFESFLFRKNRRTVDKARQDEELFI